MLTTSMNERVFAALVTAVFTASVSAATLTGTVFEDVNGNGSLDSDEGGVPGVRVTNGTEVVLSDDNGQYELTVDGDTVVFITKPAGYSVPVDADQLPQFFYIHRPNGSPSNFRYPGVDPTGPLPERIDFPITRAAEPEEFDVLLFADPQPQTDVELAYIRDDVVSELIGTEAKFGLTMGDILFDDLSMFARYNRLIAQIGRPWYNVPGNHELNFEATSDELSLETFTRVYGPRYYSFEYANAVFIVLDNVIYSGAVQPTRENIMGRGSYAGGIDPDQLTWITNELSHVPTDKLVFLAMHVPLSTEAGVAPGIHTANGGAVLQLLADHPHVYSVAGHMHSTVHSYLNEEAELDPDGRFHHHVLSTVSGSWWSGPFDERGIPTSVQTDGTPNGYHVLTVDGVSPTVRFKAAGHPDSYQMRILFDRAFHSSGVDSLRDFRPGELFDSRMTESHTASTRIYVNLFDGGPKSTVQFRIDDGEFQAMTRQPALDPHFQELAARHPDSVKSFITQFPSYHLWLAPMPALSAGSYVFEVQATDEFGRLHTAHRVLEITTD